MTAPACQHPMHDDDCDCGHPPVVPPSTADLDAIKARIRECRPRTMLRGDAAALAALEDREVLFAEMERLRAALEATGRVVDGLSGELEQALARLAPPAGMGHGLPCDLAGTPPGALRTLGRWVRDLRAALAGQ